MKIVVVLNGKLENLPPVLSICHILADSGHETTLLTNGIEKNNSEELQKKNVRIITFTKKPQIKSEILPIRALRWISFRNQVWQYLKKETFDFLWIASAETALLMGNQLLKEKYVLQLHELYDQYPNRLKKLKPLAQNALKVVAPEKNRCRIFRAWFDLTVFPVVLPNKPYDHPRTKNIPISSDAVNQVFRKIPENTKIVLYQGGIGKERDLRPIAKAIKELGAPWMLIIQGTFMGKDDYTRDFLTNYQYTMLPPVPAPTHLETASHAYIGLAAYVHDSLNTEYCAPNKIYEYTGFSLPVIANDVAGLEDTIGAYHAGFCLNFATATTEEIKAKLLDIDKNYTYFSAQAKTFYEANQNEQILQKMIMDIQHI